MSIRCRLCCRYTLLIVAALAGPLLSRGDEPRRIFIREDSDRGDLCGYVNEDEWAQVANHEGPEVVAVAETVEGGLTTVFVYVYTEDTSNYDKYVVDKNGNIRRLNRSFDNVSAKITREQVWRVRGGQIAKVTEAWMEFKTHKPLNPNNLRDRIRELPIVARLRDFPFYALIVDEHPERWPNGKRCIAGNMVGLVVSPPK